MDPKTREQIEEYHDGIRDRSTPPGWGLMVAFLIIFIAWAHGLVFALILAGRAIL